MGAAVVGALRVNLTLNSAQYSKGLKKGRGDAKAFSKSVKRSFVAIGAAVSAVTAAISAGIKRNINDFDKLAKTAQSVGSTTKALSGLRYAADLSGLSFEELTKGMRKVSQSMLQVVQGSVGPASKAFEILGISVVDTEGKMKSSDAVISEISDKFKTMKDGTLKTALAMDIFGKSGSTMIPLLNAGSAGIKSMTDEAAKFGLVVDGSASKSAERFNDNLTRVKAILSGVLVQVTSKILPVLTALSDRFVLNVKSGDLFKNMVDTITSAINGMIRAVLFVVDNLSLLFKIFKVLLAAKIVGGLVGMAGAFLTMARAIRATGLVMVSFTAISRASLKGIVLIAGAIAIATGKFEDLEAAMARLWARAKKLLPDDLTKGLGDLFSGIDLSGASQSGSFETYLKNADNAAKSFGKISDITGNVNKKLGKSASKTKTIKENLDKTAEQFSKNLESGAEFIGDKLEGVINKTQSWNDALRDVFASLAKIALKNAAIGLLQNGGGGSGGGISGAISGVLGSLFKTGFATGGSFSVGGSGGVDSQPVSFMASPDETVTVQTKQQQRNGGAMGLDIKLGWSEGSDGKLNIHIEDIASAEAEKSSNGVRDEIPGVALNAISEQQARG